MEIESLDSEVLLKLIAHLEQNEELKAQIKEIPKQDELFMFLKLLEGKLQDEPLRRIFQSEMTKFLNIPFQINNLQPSIVYYTLIQKQDPQIITNKLYKLYEETINRIIKSKTGQDQIPMACNLIRKLRQLFVQDYANIRSEQQFENSFDVTMDEDERSMYDSILGENSPQTVQTQQIVEPTKNDFVSIFNVNMTKLMEARQRQDLKYKWVEMGYSIREFQKFLQEQSKQSPNLQLQNKEFVYRLNIFTKLKNFYQLILTNFLDIPNQSQNFQQKLKAANDLKKKIEDMFKFDLALSQTELDKYILSILHLNTQNQEDLMMAKVLLILKYFFSDRTQKFSLKRVLEQKLLDLYKESLIESYKKTSEKLSVSEFYRNIYSKLKGSSSEVEFQQILNLLFQVKQAILKYYKFRACYIGVLDTLVAESEQADRTEFLIDIHLKQSMDIKLMLQICYNQNQQIQFPWANENIEESQYIQKRLLQDNNNTEYIREQLEMILRISINRGLLILSKTQGTSRPQDIFNNFPNYEDYIFIKQKSIFSEIKEALNFFKQIGFVYQKQQSQDSPQNQPTEVFGWYNFIQSKLNILYEYARQIKDNNLRNQIKNIVDEHHFRNPKQIEVKLQKLLENIQNKENKDDQEIIKKILIKLKIEQKLSEHSYKFIDLSIKQLEKQQFRERIPQCLDQFKISQVFTEKSDQPFQNQNQLPIEQFYFYTPILYLHLYMLSEEPKKYFNHYLEYLEKYRYSIHILLVSLYHQSNGQDIYESTIKLIQDNIEKLGFQSIENGFVRLGLPLETQYNLVQNFFNYSFPNYLITKNTTRQQQQKLQYFNWTDQFPTVRLQQPPVQSSDQKLKLSAYNDKGFNLCCYLTQLIASQKNEKSYNAEIENISKEIEILSKQKYKSDDFRSLNSNINSLFQQKHYTDVVNFKQKLINDSEKFNNDEYSNRLSKIFGVYFHKNTLVELSIKEKKNLKLSLNKEETLYDLQSYFERRKQQILSHQNTPDKIEKVKKLQEYFPKFLTDIKNIQKDYTEFVQEIYQYLESKNSGAFPILKDFLNEYFKPQLSTLPLKPQQTTIPLVPAPVKPQPVRLYINESAIEKKILLKSRQFDMDRALKDAFCDKFKVFMEDFLSKIFQLSLIYTANDEFKVYHAGKKSKPGQKSLLDNNPKLEAERKQLSLLYQVYGPTKECDLSTTLLISQEEISQKKTEYQLHDLTHQCAQPNFQKFLQNTDKQQEELMKSCLLSKRWKTERPELNDILTKKIKRGTDLGEALQNYYNARLSDERKLLESESNPQQQLEKMRYDDSDTIRNVKGSIAQFRDDRDTKIQMENKLKNLVNNEITRKREIKQIVVQMVLEEMPFFKKSKSLMKSYLFVLPETARKKD